MGRGHELELIRSFLQRAAVEGDALLLTGDAGVGKTALLAAAAEHASTSGTRVLRSAGVEFEADISFSGLNQTLLPLLDELGQLELAQREPLSVALGFSDSVVSDQLVVCNATVSLLRHAAGAGPVLVVVDDLQWLDRSSQVILAFAARRLGGSPVGFLAATRPEPGGFFNRAGLPEHEVPPLDDEAARALVGGCFPELAADVRNRVVGAAEGNPLALLELPAALTEQQKAQARVLPTLLPLGPRLRALLSDRVASLPAACRQLLLLSVLEGSGDLRLLQATAPTDGLDDLTPAEHARLVRVDDDTHRLVFRHPLIRSAIFDLSTNAERRRAHRQLAGGLVEEPERRAWHLAEATSGPDEEVAQLLEQAAQQTLRRGDAVGAVGILMRAAELSPAGPGRGRRMITAAYIGADVTGDLRTVTQLLADARRSDPTAHSSLDTAVAASYVLLNGEGDVETAHRLLVSAIDSWPTGDERLAEGLYTLLLVCLFGGRAALWDPFHAALPRLASGAPRALGISSETCGDPARASAATLAKLDSAIDALTDEADPTHIVRIGIAGFYVDRLGGCRAALWRVVRDGRDGGAVTSAIDALMLLSFDDYLSGEWDEADRLASEGLELCETHGYRLLGWPGRFCKALLAAARGDDETTRSLTDEMIEWATPRRAGAVEFYARHALALGALGRGAYEDAYQQVAAIGRPGFLDPGVPHAVLIAMDVVESAVRTNRHAEAVAHVAALRDSRFGAISSRFAMLERAAAAMTAPDDDVRLFQEALSIPGADRAPFDFSRVQLALGERFRRSGKKIESREHLAAALDRFDRLGAEPWAARAAAELRATGQRRSRRHANSYALTPQEREIAELAASGISNRQIGQRLHLSHRTVGAHLYRIFPKLGISSRAGLRDALTSESGGRESGPNR